MCLLRLSALGDVTHVVPLVRTLQAARPDTPIHWIIDKVGHKLLDGLPGVTFHAYDKKSGMAGVKELRRQLPPGRFEALLQMQVAFRANLLSAFIPAERRIGYDRSRSKDLHGLFINERIPDRPGIHVLDAIGSFCEPLGLRQTEVSWDLAVPQSAYEWAAAQWHDDGRPVDDLAVLQPRAPQLVRRPLRRRGQPRGHARLAGGAVRRPQRTAQHGRRHPGTLHTRLLDLVGKDTLKQLPALLARANLVMTPDSGPMHIANAMAPRCWACMRPAIRTAAARTRIVAIAWTATTMRHASTSPSRPPI